MNRMVAAALSALGVIGLVVWLWLGWNGANRSIAELTRVQNETLLAARIVTDNPKLEAQGMAVQLTLFAGTVDDLRETGRICSERVDALSIEQARLQAAAADARAAAAGRISAAERGRAALEASALQPVAAGACLSDELKRRWK